MFYLFHSTFDFVYIARFLRQGKTEEHARFCLHQTHHYEFISTKERLIDWGDWFINSNIYTFMYPYFTINAINNFKNLNQRNNIATGKLFN